MKVQVKSNKVINQIFHLSDIHICALKRHHEYQEVFNRLYIEINKLKNNNSAIVITGDLLHEKDNLKPETFLFAQKFLLDLEKICDTVILMPGNHDMIENNPDRIDSLTPIVRGTGVYYLLYSGAYKFGNIIFGVSSLRDKKDVKRSDIPNFKNCIYIALFHGMVDGCKTDTGWVCNMNHSTRGKKISYFNGYDYVLLGDIHRMQFFGKRIAYAGSLIQQNKGENIEGHGMIVWDLKNDTSKFVPIHNDYGFVDVYAKENKMIEKKKLPPKPSIRLFAEQCTDDFIKEQKKIFEKDYKVQSFLPLNRRHYKSEEKQIEGLIKPEDDIDILKKEIKKYSKEDQNLILKFHAMMKSNVDTNDFNVQYWKILEMKFSNVMIYGGDEVFTINFAERNGITSIIGDNAIGKSAIMKLLIYGLFGKITKVANDYQLYNNFPGNKKHGFIQIDFLYGSKKYRIRRDNIKRKKRGNKITFDVKSHFEDLSSTESKNQNAENETQTKKKIEKFLCSTAEDFLITNIYANNMECSILNAPDSHKIKMFNQFFKLDWYKKLSDNVKQNINTWKTEIIRLEVEITGLKRNIQDIVINEDIEKLKKELEAKITLKDRISNKIQKLNSEIEELRNQEKELQKKIQKVEIKDLGGAVKELKGIGDIEKMNESEIRDEYITVSTSIVKPIISKEQLEKNRKEIVKSLGKKPVNSLEKISEMLGKCEYEKNVIAHEMSNVDEIDVSEGKEMIEDTLKKFDDIGNFEIGCDENRLEELQELIGSYNDKVNDCVKYFEELEENGDGEFNISSDMKECVLEILKSKNSESLCQEYENLRKAKDYNKRLGEKKILEHKLKYIDFLHKKERKEELIRSIDQLNEQRGYYELQNELEEINEGIEIHTENEKYLKQLEVVKKKLEKVEKYKRKIFLEEQVRIYRENLDNQKQIDALAQKGTEKELMKNRMHDKLVSFSESAVIYEGKITNLSQSIEKRNKFIVELRRREARMKKLKERHRIAKIYKELVDANGIPMKLVKTKIEDMEQHINDYLKDFAKFKIKMFEEGGKICIDVIKNKLKLGVMDISGYETFVLNIAIKSAFGKHSLTGKCSLMCIDEGLDALDQKNWEKLSDLLDRLKEEYDNIILITHIPDIRSFEDNSIQIARMEEGYSKIV